MQVFALSDLKRWLAYAGLLMAGLAVLTEARFLAWAAIALLALSLGLRLIIRARERRRDA